MMFRTRVSLFCLVLLALITITGCASHKRFERDDLRAALVSGQSYAAETLLFIDYVGQRRATRAFARGHATQLAIEIRRSYEELEQATPEPGTENAFQTCKRDLDLLSQEIVHIPGLIGNGAALNAEQTKISALRSELVSASSSL